MATTFADVVTAAPLFSVDVVNQMTDQAELFLLAEKDREAAAEKFVSYLGKAPTYAHWQAARESFVAGVKRIAPAATGEALQKRWERFLSFVADLGHVVPAKPKAETPAAEAMRKARENPYKGKPVQDIAAAVSMLSQKQAIAPSLETAKELTRALEAQAAAQKAETDAKKKAEAETLKPRREAARKLIAVATAEQLAMLEWLFDATHENNSAAARQTALAHLNRAVIKVSASLEPVPATKPAKPAKTKPTK